MVVAFHTAATIGHDKYIGQKLPGFSSLDAGVQLFFVLSGFVIYVAHRGDAEKQPDRLAVFFRKRFLRLFPALCVVISGVLLIKLIGGFGPAASPYDITAAYLLLPVEKEALLAVEWTLRHEVLFYGLFAVFIWKRSLGLILLLCWGLGGGVATLFWETHWLIEFLLNVNHALFVLGMGVGWLYSRNITWGAPQALVMGTIIFAGSCAVKAADAGTADMAILPLGVGAAGIVFGLASLEQLNRPLLWLNRAGYASYALYLIHYPLISGMMKLTVRIERWIVLDPWVLLIVVITACQLAALLFHRWVERPIVAAISDRTWWPARSPASQEYRI